MNTLCTHTHSQINTHSLSLSVSESVTLNHYLNVTFSYSFSGRKKHFHAPFVARRCCHRCWCCCYCHWFLAAWFVGNGHKTKIITTTTATTTTATKTTTTTAKRKRKCTDNWSTFLWHVGNISINSVSHQNEKRDNNNNSSSKIIKLGACCLFVQPFWSVCVCVCVWDDVLLNASYVVAVLLFLQLLYSWMRQKICYQFVAVCALRLTNNNDNEQKRRATKMKIKKNKNVADNSGRV